MAAQTIAYADPPALADGACSLAAGKIADALEKRGRALIVLSGGSTPRETYRLLAREIRDRNLPVERLLWLLGDERWVAPTAPRSNEAMARESLLDPLGAPAGTVLSWEAGAGDPVDCARRYAEKVESAAHEYDPDIVFLGMGADGHTASLFPDGVVHPARGPSMPVGPGIPGLTAAVFAPSAQGWRLTLCPGILNRGRTVMFLVSGEEKAAALARARSGDPATPAAWIRGRETLYLVTRNALGPEAVSFGRDIRHA